LERDLGNAVRDAPCECGLVVLDGTPPTRCGKCGGWLPTLTVIETIVTADGRDAK